MKSKDFAKLFIKSKVSKHFKLKAKHKIIKTRISPKKISYQLVGIYLSIDRPNEYFRINTTD